jgi:hypothetical protein
MPMHHLISWHSIDCPVQPPALLLPTCLQNEPPGCTQNVAGGKSNAAFRTDKDDNTILVTAIVVVVDHLPNLPLSMQPQLPGKVGHGISIH